MITDYEVKQAMNRLAAVYPRPKDAEAAAEEWGIALKDKRLNVQPDELTEAVTLFIATVPKTFGFPPPAEIVLRIRAKRPTPAYQEPEHSGRYASPEDVRLAWSKYVDLDELKRMHQARVAKRRRG